MAPSLESESSGLRTPSHQAQPGGEQRRHSGDPAQLRADPPPQGKCARVEPSFSIGPSQLSTHARAANWGEVLPPGLLVANEALAWEKLQEGLAHETFYFDVDFGNKIMG